VVAVVTAQALSWHRITLPEKVLRGVLGGRMEAARVRGILAGVLEERLLDEADTLHFAVFAATPADDAGNAWVAVCGRAWLQGSLQALEAAGRPVERIVAECTPTATGTAQLYVAGSDSAAQMVLCTPQGVSLLPLQDAGVHLAQATPQLQVLAEPAAVALAQQHFGNQVTLQPRAEQRLQAAQSPWNLAQLDLTASASGRMAKRLGSFWQQVLHAAPWRPARWALLALVLVQLVALNAEAWYQRSLLADKRAAVQAVLTQTFPDTKLVVDAPLQMQREVSDLARARGMGSDTDLGRVLALLSPLWPSGSQLQGMELSGKQVRLQASGLDASLLPRISAALDSQGLRGRLQDGALVIEPKEAR